MQVIVGFCNADICFSFAQSFATLPVPACTLVLYGMPRGASRRAEYRVSLSSVGIGRCTVVHILLVLELSLCCEIYHEG